MGFDINYMGKVSASANPNVLTIWNYNGTNAGAKEKLYKIVADGFFNSFMQNVELGLGPLQVNDLIHVFGSDTRNTFVVTKVKGGVTLETYVTPTPPPKPEPEPDPEPEPEPEPEEDKENRKKHRSF